MYLVIHENGDLVRVNKLTADEIIAYDEGVIDLLDISEANSPKRYIAGEWCDIELVTV